METVSEKFRAARARASRALDDVDRSRATRALAVVVAIATLATLNPPPESFHAVCARGAHAGTSLAEKALPIRATRSWACSNGGFLRAVRLRREAFSVADLFVASIARVRDGSHFFGCLGTWVAVPRALGPIATLAVDVPPCAASDQARHLSETHRSDWNDATVSLDALIGETSCMSRARRAARRAQLRSRDAMRRGDSGSAASRPVDRDARSPRCRVE